MSESDKDFGPSRPEEPIKSDAEDIEGQLEDVDPIAETKLVRKLDIFLVPVVMLLYLLSFLDR